EGTEPAFRTGGRGVRISSLRQRVGRTSKLGPRTRIGWRVVCAVCPVFLGGLEVRIHLPPAASLVRTSLLRQILGSTVIVNRMIGSLRCDDEGRDVDKIRSLPSRGLSAG